MNKETISYVRHIMRSDFVQLDFFNTIIAAAIIAVSFIAFISGSILLFCAAFILGCVLALFNMIKSVMKRSPMGVTVFGIMIPMLVGVVFYLYKYLV